MQPFTFQLSSNSRSNDLLARFLLMSRVKINRALAEGIMKTIQRLESDPEVDRQEPAFIHLKCTLVQRLLSLELDTAELRARIHLVESADSEAAEQAEEDKSEIA
jgi:hypothetical protein